MRITLKLIVKFLIVAAFIVPAIAQTKGPSSTQVVGRASFIDGDTLEIHGTRIRFYGIDAPESGQSCLAGGKRYRCGQRAALALADKIGRGTVSCEQKDRDRYGRTVAVCRLKGENLNAWMVSQGWAIAYRHFAKDYVRHEREASTAKRGLWQGEFVAPWDWRRGKRLTAANDNKKAKKHCVIKGNISSKGERIYHVPGGQYYSRTRINPAKGERWFCTEAEARAEGWRRSRK
jgi:endonuclease YncB( thermonuclease family)